jgi:glycerol uptake facilitator-like aquaporin
MHGLTRGLAAEALGTALLLTTVIGSTLMGEALASGYTVTAHLAASLATGAILTVLILMFGAVSGAHFNPAVTIAFLVRKEIKPGAAGAYIAVQIGAGFLGVMAANFMFGQPLVDPSFTARTGNHLWFSEFIATFGLVAAIMAVMETRKEMVAPAVGLYIMAAYWFTSSTSFANPAVTLARTISKSAAGIRAEDAPLYALIQIAGGIAAALVMAWLYRKKA